MTPVELLRFLKFITVDEDGCWLWKEEACDGNGYGQFWFRGQARGAHRVSYATFRGRIRNGNDIDHVRKKCGKAGCVNPDHLRQLTRHANSAEGGRYSGGGRASEPAPF